MDRRRDNDFAEINSNGPFRQGPPPATAPPTDLLTKYGGSMTITGGGNWSYIYGANDMRFIHANSVRNFTVKGQLPLSSLASGRNYKGFFRLKLTDQASGWQGCFVVSLTVAGSCQSLNYTYADTIGGFRFHTNSFQLTQSQRAGNLEFSLSHTGPSIRKGLIVKSFVIQRA